MKSIKVLAKYMNKKYNTKFSVYKIRYRVDKFLKQTFGTPDEDAERFVNLCQGNTIANEGKFFLSQDDEGHFIFQKQC